MDSIEPLCNGEKEKKRVISFSVLNEFSVSSRPRFYFLFICSFLFPLAVIAGYIASHFSLGEGSGIFAISCLATAIGAGYGGYLLKAWERRLRRSVEVLVREKVAHFMEIPDSQGREIQTHKGEMIQLQEELEKQRRGYEHQIDLFQSSVLKSKEEARELNLAIERKLEEMRQAYLEFEDLRKEYDRLGEEFSHYREENKQRVKHKDALLADYQKTISEQRIIIEKKQLYIAKLEGKVHDLMHEIRSLLQVEGSHSSSIAAHAPLSPQPSTGAIIHFDISLQLQRFVERAETFTGADHLGYVGGKSPRFLDVSRESYAIDLRRLFDLFRDETVGIIFVYASMEKKFLFVNNHVKKLLGWGPEKFIKDFPQLIQTGYSKWENVIAAASEKKQQTTLVIRSRSGEDQVFNCLMQAVLKGPFIHHVIGILMPVTY